MKFLLIGGSGFIGSHLAKIISKKGHEVHVLDERQNSNQKKINDINSSNIKFIKSNLLKLKQFNGVDKDYDYIVNLAALLGVENVMSQPFAILNNNAILAIKAIEIALFQKKIKSFMFASTSEVYAGSQSIGILNYPTNENSLLAMPDLSNPRSTYMLSKIFGEALSFSSSLPIIIIRPHNFYGPSMGMKHVIPQLLKRIWEAKTDKIEVFSVNHTRTFCYIDDAVNMIYDLLINQNSIGKVINVGSDEPEVKVKDLAKLLMKIVGKDLKILKMENTQGSPSRRVPDVSLSESIIGYKSSTNLKEGIKKTFDWYRKYSFEK